VLNSLICVVDFVPSGLVTVIVFVWEKRTPGKMTDRDKASVRLQSIRVFIIPLCVSRDLLEWYIRLLFLSRPKPIVLNLEDICCRLKHCIARRNNKSRLQERLPNGSGAGVS